jgi:hypothetical protein
MASASAGREWVLPADLAGRAEERAVELLKEHLDGLDQLVRLLVANETVDGSEVYTLAGRPAAHSSGESVTVAPDRVASLAEGPVPGSPPC